MLKKGKQKIKKSIKEFDKMMNSKFDNTPTVRPHEFDSRFISISDSIKQVAEAHTARVSDYFNLKSKSVSSIMTHVYARLEAMHGSELEINAFINRFNLFIKTLEFDSIRVK